MVGRSGKSDQYIVICHSKCLQDVPAHRGVGGGLPDSHRYLLRIFSEEYSPDFIRITRDGKSVAQTKIEDRKKTQKMRDSRHIAICPKTA